MRHYERVSYRHLDDSERYRDPEVLADDAWVGPNERFREVVEHPVPHQSAATANEVATDVEAPPQSRAGLLSRLGSRVEEAREAVRHPRTFVRRMLRSALSRVNA